MKFSDYIKREDPYRVLSYTRLSSAQKKARTVNVKFFRKINIIADSLNKEKLRIFLLNEYINHRTGFIKSCAKIFFFWVLPFLTLFNHRKIVVELDENVKNFFIMLCNQRVRLFDLDRDLVSIFPKAGYSQLHIEREIAYRNKFTPPLMIPIIYSEKGMLVEPFLKGIPLARFGLGSTKSVNAVRVILESYEAFYKTYSFKYSLDIYLEKLIRKIQTFVPDSLTQEVGQIIEALQLSKNKGKTLRVAITHGDMHHGNIWICDKIPIIIDWESIEFRATMYDEFFLLNGIRPPHLITKNYLEKRKNHIKCFGEKVGSVFDLNDPLNQTVLIMEDLLYRLTEIKKMPFERREMEYKSIFFNTNGEFGE